MLQIISNCSTSADILQQSYHPSIIDYISSEWANKCNRKEEGFMISHVILGPSMF